MIFNIRSGKAPTQHQIDSLRQTLKAQEALQEKSDFALFAIPTAVASAMVLLLWDWASAIGIEAVFGLIGMTAAAALCVGLPLAKQQTNKLSVLRHYQPVETSLPDASHEQCAQLMAIKDHPACKDYIDSALSQNRHILAYEADLLIKAAKRESEDTSAIPLYQMKPGSSLG
ncbi:hypothetical protein [Paraferrimonas sedimenticola]|uniref:Uncharacterized protein n=1 Tax=Paraferrimonas sedimenticola TaxID=375674 RepID=A0AA37W1N4_9GAMM|nr:hypothetical protein [Paraferrimonas sedimenticola]GLP97048.1 hypothetical protein GCM10007895_23540 [Paraferrimonas sedimenticola]